MFRLGPPAPCHENPEAARLGGSPGRFGSAMFFKDNFQVNQTLSALGKRHKGSFQGTLTSRDRAQTAADKRLLNLHLTQAHAVSSALLPTRTPRGFAGQRWELALRAGAGAVKRHWLPGGGGLSWLRQ